MTRRSETGQALVEFTLTLLVFLALMLGVLDFGRAVFMYNGVSQAAREIARVASVHPDPWPVPGPGQAEVEGVIASQRDIIFELEDPEFSCVDIEGTAVPLSAGRCLPGNWVRVETTARYSPVTPIFNLMEFDLRSSSSIEIP
jgi:hypothetical protein